MKKISANTRLLAICALSLKRDQLMRDLRHYRDYADKRPDVSVFSDMIQITEEKLQENQAATDELHVLETGPYIV